MLLFARSAGWRPSGSSVTLRILPRRSRRSIDCIDWIGQLAAPQGHRGNVDGGRVRDGASSVRQPQRQRSLQSLVADGTVELSGLSGANAGGLDLTTINGDVLFSGNNSTTFYMTIFLRRRRRARGLDGYVHEHGPVLLFILLSVERSGVMGLIGT